MISTLITGNSIIAVLGGFGDFAIAGAVYGCIAVSAFGVIYGAINWNRDDGKNE